MATELVVLVDSENNEISLVRNSHGQYEIPMSLKGTECLTNTTRELLGPGEIFSGGWENTLDYGIIVIAVKASHASANDGLKIIYSDNGVDEIQDDVYTVPADTGKVYTFGPTNKYFRVEYTNGASTQTFFSLQVILRRVYMKPSSHRIQDSIVNDDDAELVKSVTAAKNQLGIYVNIEATKSNNLRVANAEDGLAIASGEVVGTTFIHKFGDAPDFDVTDGFVDIWDGANDAGYNKMDYEYSVTDAIDSISSSNNGDIAQVEIFGLDINFDQVTQIITLTGQTRKALDANLYRVFRMRNVNGVDLLGDVYCYENTAIVGGVPTDKTKTRAVIVVGNNQTLMAIYTIPAGFTGYMRDWYCSTSGARRTSVHQIKILTRENGGVFQLKHKSSISSDGTSYIQHRYEDPERVEEKTDVVIRANTDEDIAGVSAGFDIVLKEN